MHLYMSTGQLVNVDQVDQTILLNNFIYTSTFTCNLVISYAFIYVDQLMSTGLTNRPDYVTQ